MSRKQRYYQRESEDSDFETEALQLASKDTKTTPQQQSSSSDSDDKSNQESDFSEDENVALATQLRERDDIEEDSDDDIPQVVSFASSKTEALGNIRAAMQHVVEQRKEQQLKRQRLDEKNKEQKRQKLEKLSKSRLPDILLDAIPSQPARRVPDQGVAVTKDKTLADNVHSEPGNDSKDAGSLNDEEDEEEEEFIPFDRTAGVTVVSLTEAVRNSKPVTMTAAEFKKNMLFGNRIPRQTTKEMMRKREKRRARFL